jgi:hypothetical protein
MKRIYVATSCSCRLAEEQLFSEDSMQAKSIEY